MSYDIVSLGESLLRLSPPGFCQLRRASTLDMFVVGSQMNVAANISRLGGSAAFVTKFPDSPLGLLALDACRSYGLDVSHIKLVPGGKMGVTYVEFSISPRAPKAVYDRAGSAASTIELGDFEWNSILRNAKYAFTDGIFPGLSPNCSEACADFLSSAKRNGCITCFDVNYREHLWTPAQARKAWAEILPNVDILVTNRGVSEAIFGVLGSDEDLMAYFAGEFGCKVVCLTSREIIGLQSGAWNSKALEDGRVFEGQRCEFDIIDRYGTGDAWFAGFLHGYAKCDVQFGLDFGNAMCALAHTVVGDIVHVTPDDVQAVMGDTTDLRVRR